MVIVVHRTHNLSEGRLLDRSTILHMDFDMSPHSSHSCSLPPYHLQRSRSQIFSNRATTISNKRYSSHPSGSRY
uniref:Uncharacterized protein n=1 Tax=Hyaloperonospora arabidopsidis (strain Emoy2) TaxID=559515 RepID=M4BH17_HYAAE